MRDVSSEFLRKLHNELGDALSTSGHSYEDEGAFVQEHDQVVLIAHVERPQRIVVHVDGVSSHSLHDSHEGGQLVLVPVETEHGLAGLGKNEYVLALPAPLGRVKQTHD